MNRKYRQVSVLRFLLDLLSCISPVTTSKDGVDSLTNFDYDNAG